MIIVIKDRSRVPPEWLAKAADERERAIEHFERRKRPRPGSKDRRKKPRKPFKTFSAYKDDALRDLLNDIFQFKCAYCESYYGATQPVAIEHYRPKGAVIVNGTQEKPGYYWLAADWDNLFPTCTDCNSRRTQDLADGSRQVAGKGNEFPLADNKKRARTSRSNLMREEPLLLNPSVSTDSPAQHLEFLLDGDVGVVRSVAASIKGTESIRVYALNRRGLVRARKDRVLTIRFACETARGAFLQTKAHPRSKDIRAEYHRCLHEVLRLLSPDQPFLSIARAVVASAFPRAFG